MYSQNLFSFVTLIRFSLLPVHSCQQFRQIYIYICSLFAQCSVRVWVPKWPQIQFVLPPSKCWHLTQTNTERERANEGERERKGRRIKSWQANPFSEFVLCFRTLDITLPLHIPHPALVQLFLPHCLVSFRFVVVYLGMARRQEQVRENGGLIVVPNNSRWVPSCLYSISTLTAKPTRQHLVRIWGAPHRIAAQRIPWAVAVVRDTQIGELLQSDEFVLLMNVGPINYALGADIFPSQEKRKWEAKNEKLSQNLCLSFLLSRPPRIRVCHKFVCFI